jgi:hypothetical protein
MISLRRNYAFVSGGAGVLLAARLKTLPGAVVGAFVNRETRGAALAVTMALPIVALTLPALLHLLVSPGSYILGTLADRRPGYFRCCDHASPARWPRPYQLQTAAPRDFSPLAAGQCIHAR